MEYLQVPFGITPQGTISFVSEYVNGPVSDKDFVVEQFLDHMQCHVHVLPVTKCFGNKFVAGKHGLVILPTGSRKSMYFVVPPLEFDYLRRSVTTTSCAHCSILIVISPLTLLMRDQATKYGPLLCCACIQFAHVGEETNEEDKSRVLLMPEVLKNHYFP